MPIGGAPETCGRVPMITVTVSLAVPCTFVAVIVNVKVPVVLGVPESMPVVVSKLSPGGKVPVCVTVGVGKPVIVKLWL